MNRLNQLTKKILITCLSFSLIFFGVSCFVLSVQNLMANNRPNLIQTVNPNLTEMEMPENPQERFQSFLVGDWEEGFFIQYHGSLQVFKGQQYYDDEIVVYKVDVGGLRKLKGW